MQFRTCFFRATEINAPLKLFDPYVTCKYKLDNNFIYFSRVFCPVFVKNVSTLRDYCLVIVYN